MKSEQVLQLAHTAQSPCPVERALSMLRDHWSLLVIRDLMEKPMHFNELKRSLSGVTAKTLSERLKELQECGVVKRTVYSESPIRVEYSLTGKGRDLHSVVEALRNWSDKWLPLPSATT